MPKYKMKKNERMSLSICDSRNRQPTRAEKKKRENRRKREKNEIKSWLRVYRITVNQFSYHSVAPCNDIHLWHYHTQSRQKSCLLFFFFGFPSAALFCASTSILFIRSFSLNVTMAKSAHWIECSVGWVLFSSMVACIFVYSCLLSIHACRCTVYGT